jgi:hypothetical protein
LGAPSFSGSCLLAGGLLHCMGVLPGLPERVGWNVLQK